MKKLIILAVMAATLAACNKPLIQEDPFCTQELCVDTISGRSVSLADAPLWSKKKALEHRLRAEKEINGKDVAQLEYLIRFWDVALKEEEQYGIPFGISLAQGLLESSAGRSELASVYGNHFGIKCFKKACREEFKTWRELQGKICSYQCKKDSHKCGKGSRFVNGCCVNFADDDKADRFKVYDSAWWSWRDHSKFLDRKNYQVCHTCINQSYGDKWEKCWAECLQSRGYATSKSYAAKLISLIDKYDLK